MENLKNTMRTSHKYYNENIPREYYDNSLIIYRRYSSSEYHHHGYKITMVLINYIETKIKINTE